MYSSVCFFFWSATACCRFVPRRPLRRGVAGHYTVSEEVARWLAGAAEENTSVSRLVGRMLEREMSMGGEYRRAYRRWKRIQSVPLDASRRLSWEGAHVRR